VFFGYLSRSAISFKKSRRELSIDVAEYSFVSKNKGVVRILVVFQDRPTFSHIIQKISRRDLSIDLVERMSMLKNYQNTYYTVFCFVFLLFFVGILQSWIWNKYSFRIVNPLSFHVVILLNGS